MSPSRRAGRPIRVLTELRERHWSQNPYVWMLAASLPEDVVMVPFTWRTALLGRYDVVHVHWPEYMVRGRSKPIRIANQILGALWLLRLQVQRPAVVRTMHNRRPHDGVDRFERFFLDRVDRRVELQVWINRSDAARAVEAPDHEHLMLHGSYLPWLRHLSIAVPEVAERTSDGPPRRVSAFGTIKPYKNLEALIDAVGPESGLELTIAGSTSDASYLAALEDRAARRPVVLEPGRVSDHRLSELVTGSDLVVLPYRNLYNSGALFLSLSLGTAVLVERNEFTEMLRDEFGPHWIRFYDGDLTAEALHAALDVADSVDAAPVFDSARDWEEQGERLAQRYRQLHER